MDENKNDMFLNYENNENYGGSTSNNQREEDGNSSQNNGFEYENKVNNTQYEKKYTRRVGTITFGAALVFTGVIIIMSMFGINMNFITILKCAPVLLIAFGAEILLSAVFVKDAKFKYDIFGMFMCFIIVCGSLGAAFVAKYGEKYIQFNVNRDSVVQKLNDEVESILLPNDTINEAYVYPESMYYTDENIWDVGENDIEDSRKRISVELIEEYQDTEQGRLEFVNNVKKIVAMLDEGNIKNYELYVYSYSDGEAEEPESLSITISNEFQKKMATEDLAKLVGER